MGEAVVQLGGGRLQKEDVLDPTAGIIFYKKISDLVHAGEIILEYFCSDKEKLENVTGKLKKSAKIQTDLPIVHNIIYK